MGGLLSDLRIVEGSAFVAAPLAGMTLATLTGLWLGVAPPQPVTSLLTALAGETPLESLDLLPASDSLWSESQ